MVKHSPPTLEASSVEPDEMTVSATSSLDLHCEPLSVWQIITFMIYFLFYSSKPEENVDAVSNMSVKNAIGEVSMSEEAKQNALVEHRLAPVSNVNFSVVKLIISKIAI